jgi:colanic acid biosynthesis glycosyl transferase WcaI
VIPYPRAVRFLLLNQFYPPDVAPTGGYLHDLARTLRARGHEVHVLCSRQPYEPGPPLPAEEILDGVQVHRLAGPAAGVNLARRGLGYLIFLLAAARRARHVARPDAILALTTPPYLVAVAARAARHHRSAHLQWVMDVYPDVLAAHGLLSGDGLPMRILRALERRFWREAASVIALGPFMRVLLERAHAPNVVDIPLWAPRAPLAQPAALDLAARRDLGWKADELVLLYSGNLGRGHRVAEYLEAARRLGPCGPRWVFAGGGPRRGELERHARAHPEARVFCLPYARSENLAARLTAADVHLVSLSRAWQGLIVPSKLQAAFALGRPVIFVGPPDNEAAAWILASGGGWVVEEDNVQALLEAVEAASDKSERERRGALGLAFAREHFSPERNCARLADCLEAAGQRARVLV